jgi:hypothetical protein
VLLNLLALTTGSFDQILQVDPTEPLGEGEALQALPQR